MPFAGLTIELILLVVALLLIASVIAGRASERSGVPALLLFMLIGMAINPQTFTITQREDLWVAQSIGVAALAMILFSGGLDTDWRRIRPILRDGLFLANIGVLISALLVGAFAVLVLNLPPLVGLLLGAIVSSTDAAAVFSVMRARKVNLRGNLEPLIELESGSNDPMAVFLTIGLTGVLINPQASLLDLLPSFIVQMALGAALGYGAGRAMRWIINRVEIRQEGLYPALTLALAILCYSATALVGGNGFLAVYIAGIVLGNSDFLHKRSLLRFHDGLAWLMQIAMFLTLGLLITPAELIPIAGVGLLAALFLTFVARPLSVFAALAFTRISIREKAMVSWAGLRGAVPIVLATFPLLGGVPESGKIFNLVFFIVIVSVLLQGTTISLMARRLRVQDTRVIEYHYPQEFVPQVSAGSQLIELIIPEQSRVAEHSVMAAGLPRGALVVLITRDGDTITPNGGTILQAGDRLLMLVDRTVLANTKAILLARRTPLVEEEQPELL